MTSAHVTLNSTLPVDELAHTTDVTSARDRFAELLAAHWDRAYRFAYHLTGNAADSDDLIQQAAEEAFRAFHRFQPGTRFDRWFFRIMHNSFVDRIRRDRRRKIFSLDEVTGAVTSDAADPSAIAEGRWTARCCAPCTRCLRMRARSSRWSTWWACLTTTQRRFCIVPSAPSARGSTARGWPYGSGCDRMSMR